MINWPEKIQTAVKACEGLEILEVKTLGYSPYNLVYWRKLEKGLKRFPEILSETSWRKASRRLKKMEEMEKPKMDNTERVKIFSNFGDDRWDDSLSGLFKADGTKNIKARCVILNLLWNPEYHGREEGGQDLFKKQVQGDLVKAAQIIPKLPSLCCESAHVFVRVHPRVYSQVHLLLEKAGFDVDWYPFMWHIPRRSGGIRGENTRYQMWRGNDYETFIHARSGREPIIPRPNFISAKPRTTEVRLDNSDLPPEVVEEMLKMFHHKEAPCDLISSWVLDPCCCGGGVLKEAYRLGWNVMGLASNVEEANFARRRILTARKRYEKV